MLKLSYNVKERGDFKNVFVIGNVESIWDLWFKLTHAEYPCDSASYTPFDIKVSSLDGTIIDMSKGIHEAYTHCGHTRSC